MSSFASIATPYIVVGGIFIIIQIVYLIFFKGRVDGIAVYLAWIENKYAVDLLSFLIITWVMGIPYLIYIISGIHLAADGHFEAVYIFLLLSLHSTILYLIFWNNRKWRITTFVKIWFWMAAIFIWVYLISVISLNKFFSYSGSTSVFMSLSFISIATIFYEIHMIRYLVNFNKYLHAVDSSEMHVCSFENISGVIRGISRIYFSIFFINFFRKYIRGIRDQS